MRPFAARRYRERCDLRANLRAKPLRELAPFGSEHSVCFSPESVYDLSFQSSENIAMSRVCQVTGKKPMAGNNVSHANNKTKRRFLPNLHKRRFWVESENRWVKLRVSNQGLRIIDKLGLDQVLAEVRARGVKI